MTWKQLITSSLRLIGELRPGRTITDSGSHATEALVILNSMLDQWSAERLAVYNIVCDRYTLTVNQATYSYGDGGDFDAERPARIEKASVVLTDQADDVETAIAVYTLDQWQRIGVKSTTSEIPHGVYCDGAEPRRNLTFWPVPTVAHDVALYVWQAIPHVSDITGNVTLPHGYDDAVRYNLAVRMAPEWGRVPRADVIEGARSSLAKIKTLNMPPLEMSVDSALLAGRGISLLDGTYYGAFADPFV